MDEAGVLEDAWGSPAPSACTRSFGGDWIMLLAWACTASRHASAATNAQIAWWSQEAGEIQKAWLSTGKAQKYMLAFCMEFVPATCLQLRELPTCLRPSFTGPAVCKLSYMSKMYVTFISWQELACHSCLSCGAA